MKQLLILFLLNTLWCFSQTPYVTIDSISKEKTVYHYNIDTSLGGAYEVYDAKNTLKEKGQTANISGCWMHDGKFEYFSNKGILTKTILYENWSDGTNGCHSTIHDITVHEYFKNGKLKAEKSYQSAYESDTTRVGIWRIYSGYGYVESTKAYPWVYYHKEAPNTIENAEKELIISIKKIRSFDPEINLYKETLKFEKKLLTTLSLQNSWRYPFTELSKQIRIISSKDSLLRTFSWDEMSGGSYHEMKSYIQYKDDDTVRIEDLRAGEQQNSYRNAVISSIVAFKDGYFIVGWGTFGGGAMHQVITYYKFENGVLKAWPIFKDQQSAYEIVISRSGTFNLKIDPKLKKITFNEAYIHEEKGFYQQTGKLTTLVYNDQLKIFVDKK